MTTKSMLILGSFIFQLSPALSAPAAPPAVPTAAQTSETKKNEAPTEAKTRTVANNPEGNDLPFMAEKLIRVVSWDKQSKTYELISVQFPGEGVSNATPKGMVIGISSLSLENLETNPESIVGREFETTAELPTLFPEEVEARAARMPKSRK